MSTPYDFFVIERHQLDQLKTLAKRLYSENRMDGDAMRNAAQVLDSVGRGAIPLDEGTPDPVRVLLRELVTGEPFTDAASVSPWLRARRDEALTLLGDA